jgi:hypothetical protein
MKDWSFSLFTLTDSGTLTDDGQEVIRMGKQIAAMLFLLTGVVSGQEVPKCAGIESHTRYLCGSR